MTSAPPIVLLVDDDELARKMMVRVLNRLAVRVEATHDAPHARDWIASSEEPPALLITDINLRGEDGSALAESLRRFVNPSLPVLFISGYPLTEEQLCGASCRFLQKPFTPQELQEQVRELLDLAT
jgi:CheY-like chemotaxis protein